MVSVKTSRNAEGSGYKGKKCLTSHPTTAKVIQV
jgi:hypothetical protein